MDVLLSDLTGWVSDLMRQRWQSDDALQDLYAQAISARLTIQELDAQAGRAPRAFPPLPPYPYPPVDREDAPDHMPAAETAAGGMAPPDDDGRAKMEVWRQNYNGSVRTAPSVTPPDIASEQFPGMLSAEL